LRQWAQRFDGQLNKPLLSSAAPTTPSRIRWLSHAVGRYTTFVMASFWPPLPTHSCSCRFFRETSNCGRAY